MVEGEGFEPSKAEPSDLQSDPFGHSGTPPQIAAAIVDRKRFYVKPDFAKTTKVSGSSVD
ncbi:MAG: hypothetical protein PWP74_826 [Shewanella sp.]|nr:hypothetical protein [Shewanella sp.]